MAALEYGTSAGIGLICFIAGYLLSQIISGNKKNRNTSQLIKENNRRRWKIDKAYSDILLEKNPIDFAKNKLSALNKILAENETDKDNLNNLTKETLADITKIQHDINNEKIPLNQLYLRDNLLSGAMTNMAALRQKAEDCNNTTIYHGYNKRFLNFVAKGMVLPGLTDVMDNLSLIEVIENPYTKNIDLMESQIQGLTKGGEASMAKFKDILALD